MNSNEAIRNLTPHNIHVFVAGDKDTCPLTFPAQGKAVRVRSKAQDHVATLENGVKVYSPPAFEDVLDDFPFVNQEDDVHPDLIVSMVVGNHIPKWYRGNVYIPDTGPQSVVRDQTGKILGVKRFCIVHKGRK